MILNVIANELRSLGCKVTKTTSQRLAISYYYYSLGCVILRWNGEMVAIMDSAYAPSKDEAWRYVNCCDPEFIDTLKNFFNIAINRIRSLRPNTVQPMVHMDV